MATLDQLPPDRRAIIELVLQRGQSYEDLSETLGMPESRVREHAREALASLAPRTAERVDPQWRGQVADYVLGQQSGPQSKATRSHLKGSEAARAWALSVLDSVGHLYPGGAAPTIPAGGRVAEDGEPARDPGPARSGAAGAAGAAAGGGRGGGGGADESPADGAPEGTRAPAATAARGPLSPEARKRIRLRRAVAAAAGLLVLAVAVLFATGVFGGGGDEPADGEEAADAAPAEPQVTAQIRLEPVGGGNGAGAALIAEREGQNVLVMQGRVPPPERGEAYIVWLYNSPNDAVAVAGPQVDRRGNLQAVAPLPEDYQEYDAVDVSLQRRGDPGDRRDHSGNSVIRGPIEVSEGGGVPLPDEAAPPGGTGLPEPGSLPTEPEGG